MLLLTSSNHILLNGMPNPKIWHARGLQQGYAVSPMVFIITVDALNSLFDMAEGCCAIQLLSNEHAIPRECQFILWLIFLAVHLASGATGPRDIYLSYYTKWKLAQRHWQDTKLQSWATPHKILGTAITSQEVEKGGFTIITWQVGRKPPLFTVVALYSSIPTFHLLSFTTTYLNTIDWTSLTDPWPRVRDDT